MGQCGSLLSVVAFNFFFTVPRFTLAATAPDYPVTFLIMLIASIISSTLGHQGEKAGEAVGSKGILYGAADEQQPKAAAGQK